HRFIGWFSVGMLRVTRLLLLFEEFIEARPLFRGEHSPNRFFSLLQFGVQLRGERFHEFLRSLLAGADNAVHLSALLWGEVQLPLHPAQHLHPQAARGNWREL